jgi:hypothetical protein
MALRPLDPTIVNAYQAPKFNMPDPLQDVAALEQIKSGRVARQLHEQQLAQLQRDSLALDKLRSEIVSKGGPPNLKEAFTAMINSGVPHFVDAGIKGFQKIQDQENFANLLNPKAPEPSPEPAVSTAPVPGQAISMKPVNAPYNALATPETDRQNQLAAMAASKPEVANMLTPDMVQLNNRINAAYALGTPQSLKFAESLERQRDEANKVMSVAPGGNLVQGGKVIFTAAPTPQRPIGVSRGETLYGPNGEVIARGMAPEAPTPVKIIDEATGKVKYVTPSQAVGKIPASEFTGVSPKDVQKREAAYPQATQSVNGFETKSDQFIKELEKLRDDPGLANITGPVFGRTPSVTREGSRAQTTYDKIFAKGGFQALQDMREMSKTGGALGNVSNEEGRRLEKSVVGGLDRTQNIADVKQGINDLIDEIRGSKARVREAYDSTYEYRVGRPSAAPAATKPAAASKAPAGVPQDVWSVMTPDERKLWQK